MHCLMISGKFDKNDISICLLINQIDIMKANTVCSLMHVVLYAALIIITVMYSVLFLWAFNYKKIIVEYWYVLN